MVVTSAYTSVAGAPSPGRHYVLSPSDLTFLWDSCRRCFYLKVKLKYNPPRGVFPSIFSRMDSAMKEFYQDFRTESISPDLPPGVIVYGDRWLETVPIAIPDTSCTVTLRGKMDTAARFDDGCYGIFDFKVVEPKPEHVAFYGRQLHAYALGAERPARRGLAFGPVRRLGLMVFEPGRYRQREQQGYYGGGLHWVEIPRDDNTFMAFLGEVVSVLEQPLAPGGSPTCEHCCYRDTARRTGL